MGYPGIEEDSFGDRGLPGVNVGYYADITDFF
jgi:hypothetical protein